ncbi:TonB-dependent receptor [Hyphomicrobium sp. CS1GBMeth3]|uniref:TonB-dependent receptor n=1 Tax=Hyphomicrobium sp. CS1GBMeth3 TaxID=1892845 RepID=UPI00092FDD22|nr:TonB-dependent receptor [Hyphomicrobium sp. CS1GBMeth3]
MSFCVQKTTSKTHAFRCVLLSGCASLPLLGGSAFAQEAAQPAEVGQELPPLEVTTKAQVKQAKKKSSSQPAQSAADQPQSSSEPEPGTGAGEQGATQPGLNLDAPTATGSRLGLSPFETPASVEIIPGDTIRDRGQTNVNDAVTQNAAGFTSTAAPGNGGTGLAARGFVGHGSVMRLYDGTRLYIASGTITFPFDTWSAERIEVLRGPASVMYGEGAIGGVINVVPKKPTDYFTHEAEVAIGTDGMRRFGLGSGGPINERLSYRFDVSGIQSDGWLDQEGDFESLAASGALTYKATSDLRFTISHDHGVQSPLRYFGTPLIDGKIPDRIRDKNYNIRDSDVNYVDNWTQFKTEWSPTDWFELRNVAYRITTNRHWKNIESYAYNSGTGMIDRSTYLEIFHDQEQYGNRMDATFRAGLGGGVKNEFVTGFDVNRIDFLHTNNSPYTGTSPVDPFNPDSGYWDDAEGGGPLPSSPHFDSSIDQYALFAENRLTLSPELSVVAGIRLDRPTVTRNDLRNSNNNYKKDFSDVSWRAGAVYTPVPGLAFYGQYATGVDPVGGAVLTMSKLNADYEPTTGRQIEVGVKQSFWEGRGEWTLAFYDNEKKNLVTPNPDSPGDSLQIGQQSSRGVEVSLGLQLTDTLRYDGNVALLQAEYDEFGAVSGGNYIDYAGNRPANVPEQIVNSWLTWQFMPRWEAYAGVQWIGSVYNDVANTLKRPSATIVNAGLSYDVDDRSEIALRVFNVFDEVYATGGSSTKWQLAPPRSAEISYRIKY